MGSLYVATENFDLAVAGYARLVPMPLEYAIHAVHNNNNDLEITISWTLWYNFNLITQVLVATALYSVCKYFKYKYLLNSLYLYTNYVVQAEIA